MPEPFIPAEEETDAPDDGADVADADLIAAAEAAVREAEGAKEDGEKERDEQGRFKPAPVAQKPKEKAPAAEKPSSVIARELAKREAARAEESQYKGKLAEAEQILAKVKEGAADLARQQQEIAREKQALADARRDPAAFLRQQGWTADQFIDNAVRSKDPAYQEAIALREELSKRDAGIDELRRTVAALQAKADGHDKAGQQAQMQAELSEFWASIPQESPVWQDYEDKDDIVYMARKARQRYFDQTGKVASPKQVGEYLHYKALEKRAASPAQTTGQKLNAGKTKAKVPRALGSGDASERRAGNGAKHIHDMTPAEEREYLMDVANNAVAGSGD